MKWKIYSGLLIILFWSISAYSQRHTCAFCSYVPAGRTTKKDFGKIGDILEKQGKEKMEGMKDEPSAYIKALSKISKALKATYECLDTVYILQNIYMSDLNPSAYTMVMQQHLGQGKRRTLCVTFRDEKKIEMNHLFISREELTALPVMEPERDLPYKLLVGRYYNVFNPYQILELEWNTTMNGLTLKLNGAEEFYFRSPGKGLIESTAYSYSNPASMSLIPNGEEEIVLQYTLGKGSLGLLYKKLEEPEEE